jgi:acetolactate decarboxylase
LIGRLYLAPGKLALHVVTDFAPDQSLEIAHCADLGALLVELDRLRSSDNLFYAIRVDGDFELMHTRAMCRAEEGVALAAAAAHQPEFKLPGVSGTMVGFWSPSYIQALEIPGYHLHFIDVRRAAGGHVLGLNGGPLRIQIARLKDFQLALPTSVEYLRADLGRDPSRDLELAEKVRQEEAK